MLLVFYDKFRLAIRWGLTYQARYLAQVLYSTRLISIVSKPIKIVVVIVVVLSIKN